MNETASKKWSALHIIHKSAHICYNCTKFEHNKKWTISFSVLSDTTDALKFKQTENWYWNAKLSRDYCNLDVTYLVCEEKSY